MLRVRLFVLSRKVIHHHLGQNVRLSIKQIVSVDVLIVGGNLFRQFGNCFFDRSAGAKQQQQQQSIDSWLQHLQSQTGSCCQVVLQPIEPQQLGVDELDQPRRDLEQQSSTSEPQSSSGQG